MKRDLELVRKILFALEEKPDPEGIETLEIKGYDDLTVRYHLLLLAQAKLIDYEPVLSNGGRIIYLLAFNPSWEGHEFLDSVRDETIWRKVKAKVGSEGTSMPFEIVKSIAIDAIKGLFGL